MQEFHAFSVSPTKEHVLDIPEGCGFHLSVVSLPRGTNGKTTLYVSVDGKLFSLATLDSQRNALQSPTDLIFNYEQKVIFFAKGTATVHCVGYRQELDLDDDGSEAPFGMEDDDGDSDADVGPNGTLAMKLPVDAITDAEAASKARAGAAESDDDEEDDEEDDEDEEGDEEDEEEDDEEGDEEDEEEDSDIAEVPRGMRASHVDPTAPYTDESDENDEEDDDDEDDSEEDDDEEAADDEEDEEDDEDEEGEDEDVSAEPPRKSTRVEGRPSGGSPAKQQQPINNSPQGRKSTGSPVRNSNGGSPQGRKSGGSPQGRRSF